MTAPTNGTAKPSDLSASAQKKGARKRRAPSQKFSPYVDCPFLGATSSFARTWAMKAILISLSCHHSPCSQDQKFLTTLSPSPPPEVTIACPAPFEASTWPRAKWVPGTSPTSWSYSPGQARIVKRSRRPAARRKPVAHTLLTADSPRSPPKEVPIDVSLYVPGVGPGLSPNVE